MSGRTAKLYEATLNKLHELCPNLQFGLEHAMADFEPAIKKAINKTFPNCEMHGCWFHSKKV